MLRIRKMIEAFIDKDEVNANHIIKRWTIGPLKHPIAKDVYYLIKDVYREHINNTLPKSGGLRNGSSPNLNVDQNGQPRGVELSVAYDEQTNTVFLSCNQIVYKEIKKLVDAADEEKADPSKGN
jgi:hypothetical protein